MESLSAKALALEGEWSIEFSRIAPGFCEVYVENRSLHGKTGPYIITGDFRLNDHRITVFLRVRNHVAGETLDTILSASGAYDTTTLILEGVVVERDSHRVTVIMQRSQSR